MVKKKRKWGGTQQKFFFSNLSSGTAREEQIDSGKGGRLQVRGAKGFSSSDETNEKKGVEGGNGMGGNRGRAKNRRWERRETDCRRGA